MTKKDKILQAAIECFSNYGYEKTTMKDIGKRVGLNKTSLYYHYKDKSALYSASIESIRSIYRVKWSKEKNNYSPGIDIIVAYINHEVGFLEELAISLWSSLEYEEDDSKTIVVSIIAQEYFNNLVELIDNYKECDSQEVAKNIILVVRGLLMVDCPLEMPVSKRSAQYQLVRDQLTVILTLMLKGLD